MSTTKETILEDQYQLKQQKEHILDAPDTYIGGVEEDDVVDWTMNDSCNMEKKSFRLVPGLYKCFDEGVVNCRDHQIRMAGKIESGVEGAIPVTLIDIDVNKESGMITLLNNGDGIDVAKHPIHGMYIPEMIFGHLMSSTNYNKSEKKIVGGKNGFGFKLVLIFSKIGRVETVDHRRGLKYVQEFSDNLSVIGKPKITKCSSLPYTKVSFVLDFARFGVTGITDDIFNILKKRSYDIAAVTDKSVRVKFNGETLPVRNFEEYMSLFIGPKQDTKRIYEKSGRWEYGIACSLSGEADHISYVNGVNTAKGGKHVDYMMNQIIRKVCAYILLKKKIKVTTVSVKEQLMLFLNVAIENPSFDSQTKNYLNTPSTRFGSRCEVSDKFIEYIAKKLGVMDSAINLTQVKANNVSARKTDGSQTRSVRGIPKLVDANFAGTRRSTECVLILCEGDSAKAGILSGMAKDDRNTYGVFPLKGKVMNASGVSDDKINSNAEVAAIKKIMGLKSGEIYETEEDVRKHLRYGSIMFMTDQDLDGAHIKGLCINLFNAQWPELTKVNSFLGFMNTPIIKAKKGSKVISFYTEQEYEVWKGEGSAQGWTIKYFKGLGTSTAKEFKEYFLDKRVVRFTHSGDDCMDAIDLAFNKKRADDRKTWLRNYDKDTVLDISQSDISFKDFTDGELIHFSKYDCDRSIPNLVDGNKISQRKVLYACFKRNLKKEIKVAQLAGYVSEHSGYHHGEASLVGCIIGCAQEYVGSNNINTLMPGGQFGTRIAGGKDSASERYIYTHINPITMFIYNTDDRAVLNYLTDDGSPIEPEYYVPIIPMIAVNGATGIGTGFSCDILPHHTGDIIDYLEAVLEKRPLPDIRVYCEGFTGTIEKIADDRYLLKGTYEIVGTDMIRITELPVGTWTGDFKEHLESLIDDGKKGKKSYIVKNYTDMSTDTSVDFKVNLVSGTMNKLLPKMTDYGCNELEKRFKLYTTKTTRNMYLFDAEQKLKKYDSIVDIINAYIPVRLHTYGLRIAYLISQLEKEVMILTNKARFIQEQCDDVIDLRRKKQQVVVELLEERGYDTIDEDSEFKYLRSMPLSQVEEENMERLIQECARKNAELGELKCQTPEIMWLSELQVLRCQYNKYRSDRIERQRGTVVKRKGNAKATSGKAKATSGKAKATSDKAPKVVKRRNIKVRVISN